LRQLVCAGGALSRSGLVVYSVPVRLPSPTPPAGPRPAEDRAAMPRYRTALCAALLLSCGVAPAAEPLALAPKPFTLRGQAARHGRVARQRPTVTRDPGGARVDPPRGAASRPDTPGVARAGSAGAAPPAGDGRPPIPATAGGRTTSATVTVVDGARLRDVTFE